MIKSALEKLSGSSPMSTWHRGPQRGKKPDREENPRKKRFRRKGRGQKCGAV